MSTEPQAVALERLRFQREALCEVETRHGVEAGRRWALSETTTFEQLRRVAEADIPEGQEWEALAEAIAGEPYEEFEEIERDLTFELQIEPLRGTHLRGFVLGAQEVLEEVQP